MNLARKAHRQYGKRERAIKKGTPNRRVIRLADDPRTEEWPLPPGVEVYLHATKGYRRVRVSA